MGNPPGWLFHAVLAFASTWLLWALGLPGFAFLTVVPLLWLLSAAAVVWMVKTTVFGVRRRRGTAAGGCAWFLMAPAGAAVVAALAWGGVPLQARWAVSEAAFVRVVEEAGPPVTPMETGDIDVPSRVGAYRILHAYRIGTAVLFVEPNGMLFDDAGFAYLPDGPVPELEGSGVERPRFRWISGSWYAWTASW